LNGRAKVENILFPVDFSPSCAAMAAYVKRAASIHRARVTLVHVVDLAGHNGFELYVRPLSAIAEDHREIARQQLDSFLESEFPVGECSRVLLAGDAAAGIAQFARTGGFDMIVMPTYAGSFRRMLLGSTTAKVLNDADCPVVTTRHALDVAPRPMEHREWLCAIGLDADSERVLRYASRLAAAAQARLSLIHVVASGDAPLRPQLRQEEQVESALKREAHRRLRDLQKAVGSEASVRIAVGPVKEALIDEARRSEADVLVIGRGPEFAAQGRIRDLTYAMVRDSPCPVASV
jgi:nucleotide-binding universal stress UspA family protein